ncbi:hypothetical protein M9194_18240 [Vibrio sp. S4M6]|uniref:hypothetical protein n=1 Tax=Vibrio sinus TaxID=2946865 RepID=UPI002029C334|nr:hypothetical protein [Vibrio sinus]MCL9783372.1 hypothetical protein [Vibrio sinus]
MAEQNIAQILSAFNKIEDKLTDQTKILKQLTAKVNHLEGQNSKLTDLLHQLQHSHTLTQETNPSGRSEFQHKVEQCLTSLESKSKKTLELVKLNSGNVKKRSWP